MPRGGSTEAIVNSLMRTLTRFPHSVRLSWAVEESSYDTGESVLEPLRRRVLVLFPMVNTTPLHEGCSITLDISIVVLGCSRPVLFCYVMFLFLLLFYSVVDSRGPITFAVYVSTR